jgi:hypothetical protein
MMGMESKKTRMIRRFKVQAHRSIAGWGSIFGIGCRAEWRDSHALNIIHPHILGQDSTFCEAAQNHEI